ncbi:ANTAR domain-containing protein [Actinoplanes sp. ATCC 53533]|uniref:ANTAR domain-containing protein n=1 Tax=Actinoplanes sp. ATCC 53533 TaxID=1288362 RepID=UPI000F7B8B1F|nr:ANTAR domain-containing protein [Actinoplanes sp. ATCC 53533]
MTRHEPPAQFLPPGGSVLTDSLIELAGTADDDSAVVALLATIAQLSADLLDPVAFASVTRQHESRYSTVAMSSALALAVDEAQYADNAGPCLDTLDGGAPTSVPRIDATISWPGFRDTAYTLGLRSSLSVPLLAGRGEPAASLNLYGHDPATMAPLSAAVLAAYDDAPGNGPGNRPGDAPGSAPEGRPPRSEEDLCPGARQLIAGLVGAFAVRDTIQQAIGMIIVARQTNAYLAYALLRSHAAATTGSLFDAATTIIAGDHR